MSRLALLLLACATPALAQLTIYRWVDAQGRVHYAEEPPPGVKAERVAPAPPPGTSPNLDALRRLSEEQDKARADARTAAGKQAEQQAQKKARCEQARGQLGYLDERPPSRIARMGADGELQRLTVEEYEARRAQAQKAIDENCAP